jgi:hypothetical protein|tara:strand:- start:1267 stop:1485 length:219 start_codon:yes stop_codon:yes gene_type:complete
MKEREISDYIEYWMEGDEGFSAILSDVNNAVEDVEHYNHNGFPRSAVYMDKNLVLLFPPFQTGFDYTQIDYR